MSKALLIGLSVVVMVLGVAIYASGLRTRKSLDVPLLSGHTKLFLGGTLVFFGLVMLAIVLMRGG